VPVLVDGAHVPGHIPLDVPSLGVDFYSANLHKWAHAPRSCGFLWAAPSRQAGLHPPVISWGLDQGFAAEFDWVGTRDPSAWLAAPEGLAFLRELGEDAARAYNHGLAWGAARQLSERWNTTLGFREAHVGSMVTIPLPERFGSTREDAVRLRNSLLFEDEIEVHAHAACGRVWVRVCAQVYNDQEDIERLGEAVATRS
jgi:isopenicillin-N epimerase